ncbi:multidrug transporter [Aureimonas sp. SA4125]|nr:multidrug transporter [Aureimonas sp. SA4125]
MKIHTILNREGGTLKTTDLDRFSELIADEFRLHGHDVDIECVRGSEIVKAIKRAADRSDLDVLLVGGGDGTVSAAAAALMNHPMALAILPAGTMNLFARTLQIPLAIEAAVVALAGGAITEVDVATVNGKPFVHQFAVGMHARMVRMRDSIAYGSRLGKMFASTRAIMATLRSLPMVEVEIDIDGEIRRLETPALAVSNNVYGDGHLPFADDPRGGVLGVYICETRDTRAMTRLTFDILRGKWRQNPSLKVYAARKVVVGCRGSKRQDRAVRDGELRNLAERSEIVIHPKALRVLVPSEATFLAPETAIDDTATVCTA